jgi:transposase
LLQQLEQQNHITIFQDECGIQEDLVKTHGRNTKGQRLLGYKTGTKHKKTGIISGYTKLPSKDKYQYIAPFFYNHNCDTLLFNFWLEDILIPEIQLLQNHFPNNPISLVLDNVAYHKSDKTMVLCKENKINLVFQSPYSPDLNPIEHSWNTTKNEIRKYSLSKITFQQKLTNSLLSRTWDV